MNSFWEGKFQKPLSHEKFKAWTSSPRTKISMLSSTGGLSPLGKVPTQFLNTRVSMNLLNFNLSRIMGCLLGAASKHQSQSLINPLPNLHTLRAPTKQAHLMISSNKQPPPTPTPAPTSQQPPLQTSQPRQILPWPSCQQPTLAISRQPFRTYPPLLLPSPLRLTIS